MRASCSPASLDASFTGFIGLEMIATASRLAVAAMGTTLKQIQQDYPLVSN
jgi:hypothetical protein